MPAGSTRTATRAFGAADGAGGAGEDLGGDFQVMCGAQSSPAVYWRSGDRGTCWTLLGSLGWE